MKTTQNYVTQTEVHVCICRCMLATLIVPRSPLPCSRKTGWTYNKHTSHHRAISSAQVALDIKLLVSPNHGPLLSAPSHFLVFFTCASAPPEERSHCKPHIYDSWRVYPPPRSIMNYTDTRFLFCFVKGNIFVWLFIVRVLVKFDW